MRSQEPDKKSPMKDRSRRFGPVVAAATVLAAVLAVGLFAVIADHPCPLVAGRVDYSSLTPLSASSDARSADDAEDASMASDPQSKLKAARQAVEKLVEEQKFEAAAEEAARVREDARRLGDNPLWTWALIKEGQLRSALHGYETAVRFFKEQPWPDSPLERDMLDLFYAQSLVTYYHAYSWDIGSR
ncbi:MAG: hypothetical protein IMZ54_12280, partial [Acidobacteria bacterium]|nr:hypothetical protein [Acidobacteriota bacterium]